MPPRKDIRCIATNQKGLQCSRLRNVGSQFCHLHDPDPEKTAEAKKQAAYASKVSQLKAHGHDTSQLIKKRAKIDIGALNTARDVDNALKKLASALLSNQIDYNTANVAKGILTQLHKSYKEKKDEQENSADMSDKELVLGTVEQIADMGLLEQLKEAIKKVE